MLQNKYVVHNLESKSLKNTKESFQKQFSLSARKKDKEQTYILFLISLKVPAWYTLI